MIGSSKVLLVKWSKNLSMNMTHITPAIILLFKERVGKAEFEPCLC